MTNPLIPPLILVCATDFSVCGGNPTPWLEPDAMRRANAYVIHDPDGGLLRRYGGAFSKNKYSVKVLDLGNLRKSARYNPFALISGWRGVMKFAAAFLGGTEGLGKPGDANFLFRESLLFAALTGFVHSEAPAYELNLETLIVLLEDIEQNDFGDGYMTAVDCLFNDLPPAFTAVQKYGMFKEAIREGEARRIAASCLHRLAPFRTPEVLRFISSDSLELDSLHCAQAAVFVTGGDSGSPLSFLVPLMYAQLLDSLCDRSMR